MKKLIAFTAGVLLFIVSCTQPSSAGGNIPSGNGGNPSSGNGQNSGNLMTKKNIYKILSGTSWKLDEEIINRSGLLSTISFADDSITIDGIQYSLNQNTDFYLEEELPSSCPYKGIKNCPLYIFINNNWYGLEQYTLPFSTDNTYLGIWNKSNAYSSMRLISGGGQGQGSGSSSLNGGYSYGSATGTESNGSISLNNGTWTYSGTKSNVAALSGTYSVNGSTVTFSWTAGGYPVSEDFTITVNGSSATWQSSNAVSSTLFSMLFGVAGKTSLTLNYSE